MTWTRGWLALPLLLAATVAPAWASDIHDRAEMFSPDAVRKAKADLDRIEREYQVPVSIETVESLGGKSIDEVLPEHARAVEARGLYVLISRKDKKIEADAYKTYAKILPRARLVAIRGAFGPEFGKGNFDGGLESGVKKIDATLAEAKAEAGGTLKPDAAAPVVRRAAGRVNANVPAVPTQAWGVGTLFKIILGILAVLLVIRIIGALFAGNRSGGYAPGPGQMGPGGYRGGPGGPGYGYGGGGGGGGGGFMSSMFGGIGGALAGNWLYDQFSGGRHHGVDPASTYDPAAGAGTGAVEGQGGPDYVGPNDGGADWGGGSAPDTGGGGDWGGGDAGGGGDWGGGGGGGDWGGGGGGGDWGGGDW